MCLLQFHSGSSPTNEGLAIAEGEVVLHKRLGMDASVLVRISRGCQDRFRDLKIDERRRRRGLAFVIWMVRGCLRKGCRQRRSNEDAQD